MDHSLAFFSTVLEQLRSEKLVLMLCDTVYGFIGLAPQTYHTLVAVKGRPEEKPFLELYGSVSQLAQSAWQLPPAELLRHWPGPLTCVLGPKPTKLSQPTASFRQYAKDTSVQAVEQTSQAVRIPKHPLLQALCLSLGQPLYSTSANRSGKAMPERTSAIRKEFAAEIVSGVCLLLPATVEHIPSQPSTIVDARAKPFRILRAGALQLIPTSTCC